MEKQQIQNITQVLKQQAYKSSLSTLEIKIKRFNLSKVFQIKILPSRQQDDNAINHSKKKRIKRTKENWNLNELKILFDSISIEGPQWSLIQNLFQDKSQNSVKNKFYGTIKCFIKGIFKQSKNLSGKHLNGVNSLKLIDLYLGKKQFRKFKGFLKKYLQKMNYQINSEQIFQLINEQKDKINQLHQLMFNSTQKKYKNKFNQVSKHEKQILIIEQDPNKMTNQEKPNQYHQIQSKKQYIPIYPIQGFNHYGNLCGIYPANFPYNFFQQNLHDIYQK